MNQTLSFLLRRLCALALLSPLCLAPTALADEPAKPAEAKKGGKLPENQGKRKDEKQRTEKK